MAAGVEGIAVRGACGRASKRGALSRTVAAANPLYRPREEDCSDHRFHRRAGMGGGLSKVSRLAWFGPCRAASSVVGTACGGELNSRESLSDRVVRTVPAPPHE